MNTYSCLNISTFLHRKLTNCILVLIKSKRVEIPGYKKRHLLTNEFFLVLNALGNFYSSWLALLDHASN